MDSRPSSAHCRRLSFDDVWSHTWNKAAQPHERDTERRLKRDGKGSRGRGQVNGG